MPMTRLSKTTRMRVGLLLALLIGTLGIHWKDILPASEPDPDEIHVLRQGGAVGKLSLEVKEAGSHLHMPARLTFTYDDGREELPTVGRFQHFLVTASGRDLKTLPVGEYQVYVSRGTEYSLDRQKVKIEEGKTAYLSSTLERIVDTTGFISADFHLHLQYAMRDGAMTSAAEGIDLLTATDHNILKDYSPHIRALKLERFITSTVGSEIDTAFGHFNSFPLEIDRWGRREFRHGIRTPGEFLRIVRQEPGEQIVQINHPRRWTSSPTSAYFDQRLNADTGAFDYPYFETGFDSFEIFNAITDKSEAFIGRTQLVDQKLQDWYRLLNRGVLMAGVANTDAHRYPEDSLGYPRNYVVSETDNPWEINPRKVVQAVKRRAVTGSLGPFLHFTGNGSPVGSVITDLDRSVSLRIQLQSTPWAPVERLEVIRNGEVIKTYSVPPPEEKEEAWKFDTELVVDCQQDSWILVIASSQTPWEKPFENYRSFSFTNPVFVDVDGNGYFDPPNGGSPLQETGD